MKDLAQFTYFLALSNKCVYEDKKQGENFYPNAPFPQYN